MYKGPDCPTTHTHTHTRDKSMDTLPLLRTPIVPKAKCSLDFKSVALKMLSKYILVLQMSKVM